MNLSIGPSLKFERTCYETEIIRATGRDLKAKSAEELYDSHEFGLN